MTPETKAKVVEALRIGLMLARSKYEQSKSDVCCSTTHMLHCNERVTIIQEALEALEKEASNAEYIRQADYWKGKAKALEVELVEIKKEHEFALKWRDAEIAALRKDTEIKEHGD